MYHTTSDTTNTDNFYARLYSLSSFVKLKNENAVVENFIEMSYCWKYIMTCIHLQFERKELE